MHAPIPFGRRREAVLYRAHQATPAAAREVARLTRETAARYDVFVVGYCPDPAALAPLAGPRTLAYGRAELAALPYAARLAETDWENPIGHHDLPTLRFFRDHPHYERLWVIEYDVRYTGNWRTLFAELGRIRADLLATTVQRRADNPGWYYWGSFRRAGAPISEDDEIKAFLPFFGISRAGLAAVDTAYAAGLTGHYEGAFPIAICDAGLTVGDIGARFYRNTPNEPSLSPGTFVFRPPFRETQIVPSDPPMLWHPVKS